MIRFARFVLVFLALAIGCDDDGSDSTGDAGTPDASTDDAGVDSGTADAYFDPCATDNGGCDPLVSCTDDDGTALCGDCPTGYLGDGPTGCVVDACATDNGGCGAMRLCTSADAQATCGDCVTGYKEDGAGGCEVDACVTDNGGCAPNRICESAGGVATCGDCEFGYDDDGEGNCVRNACTLARADTYEPDDWRSEVRGTLSSVPTTWHRSLSAGEADWFLLGVRAGCEMTMEWTHEGATDGGTTFRVWSPQYGAGTTHATGPFSATGTATVPGTVPAGFDIDYEVQIDSGTLCASYSLTAWMTCP